LRPWRAFSSLITHHFFGPITGSQFTDHFAPLTSNLKPQTSNIKHRRAGGLVLPFAFLLARPSRVFFLPSALRRRRKSSP
jgi:hypothetical protein